MSFFSELNKRLQADLISFVEDREAKEKTGKTRVDDAIATGILRKIIDGDCRITGCCPNCGKPMQEPPEAHDCHNCKHKDREDVRECQKCLDAGDFPLWEDENG